MNMGVSRTKDLVIKYVVRLIPSKIIRTHIGAMIRFGIRDYLKAARTKSHRRNFKHFLSVAAIVKNEGPYLKEWIEYHQLVGVEKFHIYDNESTDDTKEILQPYINAGIVDYTFFPGKQMQRPAYTDAILKSRNETQWLAIIDLDEFIVPLQDDNIQLFIKKLVSDNNSISQILIGWCVYGSSGHKTKPKGLVIENFLWRAKQTQSKYWHKTILNPRKVYHVECHCCGVFGKTVNEDLVEITIPRRKKPDFTVGEDYIFNNKKIRVNHYVVKSWEEWLMKKYKGDAWKKRKQIKDDAYFTGYDKNEIRDSTMSKYVKNLKKLMR